MSDVVLAANTWLVAITFSRIIPRRVSRFLPWRYVLFFDLFDECKLRRSPVQCFRSPSLIIFRTLSSSSVYMRTTGTILHSVIHNIPGYSAFSPHCQVYGELCSVCVVTPTLGTCFPILSIVANILWLFCQVLRWVCIDLIVAMACWRFSLPSPPSMLYTAVSRHPSATST